MNEVKFKGPLTLDQAIPESIKDRLIYLGNEESDIQWESGDIANTIIEYVADDPRIDADDMKVYIWVAGYFGCGESTIRYRSYTCKAFPVDDRDRYYPQLTFKHFFTAKQYGDLKFKILDACLRYMDTHDGKRPPVDWIHQHFRGVGQVEEMEDHTYESTVDSIDIDTTDRFHTVTVWNNILTSTNYIRDRLMRAEIDAKRREELGQMLDDFEKEIYLELEHEKTS